MFQRVITLFVLGICLFTLPVWGHEPELMKNYIVTSTDQGNPLLMPGMLFPYELMSLLKFPPDTTLNNSFESSPDRSCENEAMHVCTTEKDLKDFAEVMGETPNGKAFMEQYSAMRKTMLTWILMADRKKGNEITIHDDLIFAA